MSEQDVEFVDWMPKEFDVFLKGLAKKENFDKISSDLIEFIEELHDDFAIERMENSHCYRCKMKGVDFKLVSLKSGEERLLCEQCAYAV